jgi:hypothetical protein
MSQQRKIAAIRALAERPGTVAEGEAARAALKRLGLSATPDQWESFRDYLHSGSRDDLSRAVGLKSCPCGNKHPAFAQCPMVSVHTGIRQEMHRRFPRGQRAYYNEWAYEDNCPCTVAGYSEAWNWIRVKFDHLKTVRSIPFYSGGRWTLTVLPLTAEEIYSLPHSKIKRDAKAWVRERFGSEAGR